MTTPKVLVLDIETAPMLAYVWGTRDVNIALNQIHKDSHILAWAAKWLGDPASKTMYRDQRNSIHMEADKPLLQPLWKLLDEADIVITQNGKNFDAPRLNARFIEHGMFPPSPYKHLDTYQIIRKVAKFTSNKLEYLTDKLCTKYKKLAHKKYPGQVLWTECLKRNMSAWDEMKKYNIHDVLATEELYTKIRAWAPDSMAKPYDKSGCLDCDICNEKQSLCKNGTFRLKTGRYQRYRCTSCGAISKGDKLK